jgi:hypothetical protein
MKLHRLLSLVLAVVMLPAAYSTYADPTPILYGDINGDGVVDWDDRILLRELITDTGTTEYFEAGDLDGNGAGYGITLEVKTRNLL